MASLQTANLLFQASKKGLVRHIVKRGFLYSSKKGVSRDTIVFLQQPIDLSFNGIRRWLLKKQREQLLADHRFNLDRYDTLGPDLATAQFVVARDGAVRFEGIEKWIKKNAVGKYYLPSTAQRSVKLEAVDASNTKMMYTSFDNFKNLQHLKYLNLSKCPLVDDWCLDRLVQFRETLLALDLSGCPEVTERGLACLHKLHKLKRLFLHNMPNVKNLNMVAVMLEEAMPNCVIEGIDYASGDQVDCGQSPSFLENWDEFAYKHDQDRMKAAVEDGVIEVTEAADERDKFNSYKFRS